MEGVPAVFHQVIKEGNSQFQCLRVTLGNEFRHTYSSVARRQAFLGIDIVADFQVESEIRLVEGGPTCAINASQDLGIDL